MDMELDTHILYYTKLSGKSLDFYFLVGTHLKPTTSYVITLEKYSKIPPGVFCEIYCILLFPTLLSLPESSV